MRAFLEFVAIWASVAYVTYALGLIALMALAGVIAE